MSFLSMVLAFAPWVAFKLLIKLPVADPLTMVKIGVTVAAVICAYQAWIGLHRGALLWGGLLFFGFALVTVPILENRWVIQHLGVLSHGTLALFTWASIAMKKPFTAEYAKQHVAPQLWTSSQFIRKNNIITGIWGMAFTISLLDAVLKLSLFPAAGEVFELIDDAVLVGAALFTSWYTKPANDKSAVDETVEG